MRILLAHNSYLQPGGEDVAFQADVALLRNRGHDVRCYHLCNDQILSMSRLSLARKSLWNRDVSNEFVDLFRHERPDILHLHNTFPLLSPSAAAAARAHGIPVVQTLHNYRMICPNAQLFRDGQLCSDCVGRFVPWPSVAHRCYRESRVASAAADLSMLEQRLARRLGKSANLFVALTERARQQFIDAGFQRERIVVRPNFLASDPGPGRGSGEYAMFAGRLSPEKGIQTLLDAWSQMAEPLELKIAGDGPLRDEVARVASEDPRIAFPGWQSRDDVLALLKEASVLVVPSLWSEGMPQIIVESLAAGTPVVASRRGAMSEMICHGESGLHFEPGDAQALAGAVTRAMTDRELLTRMRLNARAAFLQRYTAERSYDLLMQIYEQAGEVC
jgi:glycosyltransferase involved in cell wall biosynthesis